MHRATFLYLTFLDSSTNLFGKRIKVIHIVHRGEHHARELVRPNEVRHVAERVRGTHRAFACFVY